jgi:hypothetical protein
MKKYFSQILQKNRQICADYFLSNFFSEICVSICEICGNSFFQIFGGCQMEWGNFKTGKQFRGIGKSGPESVGGPEFMEGSAKSSSQGSNSAIKLFTLCRELSHEHGDDDCQVHLSRNADQD